MRAVEAGSELGTDASGQFGSTEAFDGILGHFSFPLGCDGRRVHEGYPVDYLRQEEKHPVAQPSRWTEPALAASSMTDLFDLLPEEPCDRGPGVKGDLHVIGSI